MQYIYWSSMCAIFAVYLIDTEATPFIWIWFHTITTNNQQHTRYKANKPNNLIHSFSYIHHDHHHQQHGGVLTDGGARTGSRTSFSCKLEGMAQLVQMLLVAVTVTVPSQWHSAWCYQPCDGSTAAPWLGSKGRSSLQTSPWSSCLQATKIQTESQCINSIHVSLHTCINVQEN